LDYFKDFESIKEYLNNENNEITIKYIILKFYLDLKDNENITKPLLEYINDKVKTEGLLFKTNEEIEKLPRKQ
jgi:hypothetical protein